MKMTCLLLVLASVPALARADVVHDWNEVTLATIRRTSTPPPLAARNLAIVHVAIYDAVNSIQPAHQQFRVYAPDSASTSREAAAAQAAFRVLLALYPGERPRFERALNESLASLPEPAGRAAGIRLGNLVAQRVIAWRSEDGSQRSTSYKPGNRPGQWRPTPPDFQGALLPHWSSVTPFGISFGSQFRPPFPPELRSAEYARDLQEVQALGERHSRARTPEQTEIALYWADGAGTVTPPGHWNRIAQTVARSAGLSVAENARLFALLNVALADAAIVCWDMKFACNLWRPVTAIQEADTDGNDRTQADPRWQPLLDTPPFPSCTSGHSTFSGAAAAILALYFGRDERTFTDVPDNGRAPRTFTRFSQAAEEAGRSRIYGGIHYQFDNQSGLDSGRALARYIFTHHMQPLAASTSSAVAAREAYRPTPDAGNSGVSVPSGSTSYYRAADPVTYPAANYATSYHVPITSYYSPPAYAEGSTVLSTGQVLYCQPLITGSSYSTMLPQPTVTYYFSDW